MEDYLLIEMLKNKSKNDPEFDAMLSDYMRQKYARGMRRDSYGEYPEDTTYNRMYDGYNRREYMRGHSRGYDSLFDRFLNGGESEHFDEHRAKHLVSKMYHMEPGNKMVSGEHFSMTKAKDVYETYKKMYDLDITLEDVYVAINAQYHDYYTVFKTWFGTNIDSKIIESAICFWFKDADYDRGSKLWNYFQGA